MSKDKLGPDPGSTEFYLARADLRFRENDFSGCIEACRSYLELVDDSSSVTEMLATALILRAKELEGSEHPELAMESFNEAIVLAPTAPRHSARGDFHRRLRNHEAAETDYDAAIELDAEDWAALNGKFEMFRDPGGLEFALAYFRNLAIFEGSALHHYCLGRTLFAMGDFEGAIACLTVAIQTDEVWPVEWPAGHSPHLLRGVSHLMLGDCEAAARDCASELAGDAVDGEALSERVGEEREIEHYVWATEDFERVARMRPRLLDVYGVIGDTQIRGGNTASVLTAFERMLTMYPERERAGELRARARRRLEGLARGDYAAGGGSRWSRYGMAVPGAHIAGTVLIAGAIAVFISLMSVELVPATMELMGEFGHSVSTPVAWGGLTVAAAALTFGLDRGVSLCRSAFGRAR